jgi:hypothetical protein
MEVLQLSHLLFISHQPDSYYMIDTTKKSVKAVSQTCFDLISALVGLQQDIKSLA